MAEMLELGVDPQSTGTRSGSLWSRVAWMRSREFIELGLMVVGCLQFPVYRRHRLQRGMAQLSIAKGTAGNRVAIG